MGTPKGGGMERSQSLFLLLAKRGYRDRFFDGCEAGNLGSGVLELRKSQISLTTKPLDEWSPDWFEIVEPPTGRDIIF